ncbi:MAG TPA: glycosyltransferase family 2 protein [Armatimonadota bacterium]|jgi:glycosyltransferase involved in cell wall biosynthesis
MMDDGPRSDAFPASAGPSAVLLSILIPVFNEAATVAATIARVRSVELPIEREIVIVDDGSTDGTWPLLQSLAGPDLRLLRHPGNYGKGAALRTALDAARGDLCVVQDADLEYDPEDLPRLIAPILAGEADMVYGSRFLGSPKGMKPVFRLGNWVLAWTATFLFGRRVTDEATCYKAVRTGMLRAMELKCTGFEFCPEVTAKGLRRHLRFTEVPIRYEARGANEGKKLTWRHGAQAIWTLLKYRFVR